MQNVDVQVWRSTEAGEVNVSLGRIRVASLVGRQNIGVKTGAGWYTGKTKGEEEEYKKAQRLLTPRGHGARLVRECEVW